jgi:hypothetical protein
MARDIRAALADTRALEEEMERVNPINPVRMSTRKGYTGILRGGAESMIGRGATPSMGLSQFRGGRKRGEVRKEEESEIVGMGRDLGMHIQELHGAGFFDDFAKGFMSVVKPIASIAKPVLSFIPHPAAQAASGILGALGAGKQRKQRKPMDELEQLHEMHGGQMHMATCGGRLHGGMDTGAYKGEGRRRRVKKPVSEHDGRRKRAEVVKRVMQDRGVSMIEASRIVKQEGLY